jgi:hypothetical protein
MKNGSRILSWRVLFAQTILSVFAYVFMEWLFFATKPSFMDTLPWAQKLELLLLTGLVTLGALLPVLIILRILGWIPGFLKQRQVFLYLGAAIPALVAAALSLLLIDNFTYALFQWGIVTSREYARAVYMVLIFALAAFWYWKMLSNMRLRRSAHSATEKEPPGKARLSAWQHSQGLLALILIAGSACFAVGRITSSAEILRGTTALLENRPHIIILGGDGTVVSNMSLYGYERDTTPNLRQLAETSLLAENNFTNSDHSTGSVFSMLTGKYPAQTRLLYAPNILQGADSVEHLPGILQRAGYTTVQITLPYYLDAYDVNMQEGFDVVNQRLIGPNLLFRIARRINLEDAGYFLLRLSERISDRMLHIFFVRDMPDPYREVIQALDPRTRSLLSDSERVDRLIRLLQQVDTPYFFHIHLLDTHGPRFEPHTQVYSTGETQDQDWMPDFFDDAVLEYDSYVGMILDALEENGLMDHTVLVVYSDHANNWRADDRIPLLFHFPNGEFAGRIPQNTQNLDVAPTLLDYLGMEKPSWMSGQSLIGGELSATRPIFSAGVVGVECLPPDYWCETDTTKETSAFQQFGYIQLIVCQDLYHLSLTDNTLTKTLVRGHTAPCPQADLPDNQEAHQIILDHLFQYGFDISPLE